MRTYLGLLTNAVRSALRSKHDLMLENLALRQQLALLTRQRARTRTYFERLQEIKNEFNEAEAEAVTLAVEGDAAFRAAFEDEDIEALQDTFRSSR